MVGFSRIGTAASLALAAALGFGPARLSAEPGPGGAMGPLSRSSIRISLSVAPRFAAERTAPAQRLQAESGGAQPFCIWSNAPLGTFSVTAAELDRPRPSGAAAPAYELEWRDGTGRSRAIAAGPGASLSGLAARSRDECRSGETESGLRVRAAADDRGPGAQGSGSLLLLIAPD